jgi:hypothetical protein
MSPMSTAAMNAVDRTKAGVASGTLSMSRMVGGTFGVAVMGALVTAIGKSKIDQGLPQLPAGVRSAIADALGAGAAPRGDTSPHVLAVVREAFVSALGTGLTIGASVTLIGAVVAFSLVRNLQSAPAADAPPDAGAGPIAAARPGDPTAEADAELTIA